MALIQVLKPGRALQIGEAIVRCEQRCKLLVEAPAGVRIVRLDERGDKPRTVRRPPGGRRH